MRCEARVAAGGLTVLRRAGRGGLFGLLGLALALSPVTAEVPPKPPLREQVGRSVRAGLRALIAAQSEDGSWRSRTYGGMKDGLSLTPPVLKAIVFGPEVEGSARARAKGLAYLIRCVQADGSIDGGPTGLGFPVYTASTALLVLSRSAVENREAQVAAWTRELRSRQLTEALGWQPADPAYGGWGDAFAPARKLDARTARTFPPEADVSSTLFAVSALRVSGVPEDDPAVRRALAFVERCQNWQAGGDSDPALDDGGFFFSPTNTLRNKAGEAGKDRRGRIRYRSYGSATADGLRALLRCGLGPDHPRVQAARRWLERHFSVTANPGAFEPAREVERESTFFYFSWSFAHAFRALGVESFEADGRRIVWTKELARELIRRQRPDGTWANRYSAAKEDDPLVASALALGALGTCELLMQP